MRYIVLDHVVTYAIALNGDDSYYDNRLRGLADIVGQVCKIKPEYVFYAFAELADRSHIDSFNFAPVVTSIIEASFSVIDKIRCGERASVVVSDLEDSVSYMITAAMP